MIGNSNQIDFKEEDEAKKIKKQNIISLVFYILFSLAFSLIYIFSYDVFNQA